MSTEITITTEREIGADELHQLYTSVGWSAYTKDRDALAAAVANSTYAVMAWAEDQLIGLARGLSDDVSVFYLQDILVRPEWQHQGVGRSLIQNCLSRFAHVRQKVLLTDDLSAQHRFYESMGYTDTRRVSNVALHAFVQIEGIGFEQDDSPPLEREDVGH